MFETAVVYQQTPSMQQSYAKISETTFNCNFNYPIVLSVLLQEKQLKVELVYEPSKLRYGRVGS